MIYNTLCASFKKSNKTKTLEHDSVNDNDYKNDIGNSINSISCTKRIRYVENTRIQGSQKISNFQFSKYNTNNKKQIICSLQFKGHTDKNVRQRQEMGYIALRSIAKTRFSHDVN